MEKELGRVVHFVWNRNDRVCKLYLKIIQSKEPDFDLLTLFLKKKNKNLIVHRSVSRILNLYLLCHDSKTSTFSMLNERNFTTMSSLFWLSKLKSLTCQRLERLSDLKLDTRRGVKELIWYCTTERVGKEMKVLKTLLLILWISSWVINW